MSEICASPSAATMSAASRPESYIVANTSFATVELIVPLLDDGDETRERRRA